jgi:steroid delta-isomerase-like uncharacterized protein
VPGCGAHPPGPPRHADGARPARRSLSRHQSLASRPFADDAVDHDPAPDQGPGREGFREFFTTLATAFPDAHIEAEQLVADDDHVCIAYTLTGTHEGEFHGVPPAGNEIEVRGVQIGRFEDGQIVERWGSSDELGILKQLGVEPAAR